MHAFCFRQHSPRCRAAVVPVLTFLALLVLGANSSAALAADDVEPIELMVSPAAEPVPALRYHLLVPPEDRLPGNAVPIYLRLTYEQSDDWRKLLREEPSRLLDFPARQMPLPDAERMLGSFDTALEQISAAALRSGADWEYVMEGQDPIMVLLPDAQSMRNYARLLAVKARYDIRKGNLPSALTTLRDGIALAEHVAAAPFLVNQLIGIATAQVMLTEADGFVEANGAPNLYWALAELPRPLISLKRGMATESQLLRLKFPELDVPSATHDWPVLAKAMRRWAAEAAQSEGGVEAMLALAQRQTIPADELARARRELQETLHLSKADVAAMSDAEVEVRYTVALFGEISDAMRKWVYVPYAASFPLAKQRGEELLIETQRRELYPLVSLLLPVSTNLPAVAARTDRLVARLQAIEAIRMHAAQTGKLPEKLERCDDRARAARPGDGHSVHVPARRRGRRAGRERPGRHGA